MARPRFGGVRRTKQWGVIPGLSNAFTDTASQGGGAISFTEATTVLRMLGSYIVVPINAPVVGESGTLAVGIAVISSDAFAAGGAALPDPIGEPEYPWLYWGSHQFFYSSVSLDPSSAGATLRHRFDIRSMRKIKPRESLAMVVEYARGTGSVDLQFEASQTRVLLALS